MLSNTATPKYYTQFRDKVMRGEIPVCKEVSMEMNRIDSLIADPRFYYDPAVFDLNNLITVSRNTHNAIHYGSLQRLTPTSPIERTANDQIPWG